MSCRATHAAVTRKAITIPHRKAMPNSADLSVFPCLHLLKPGLKQALPACLPDHQQPAQTHAAAPWTCSRTSPALQGARVRAHA